MDLGAPLATELPFVKEPLLSGLGCESPFATLPSDALSPGDLEEPFVKLCVGDWDRFEASLSRRIVPSDLRLRFEMCREGRPLVSCDAEPSESWSSSERLCLRLPVVSGTEGLGAVMAGCPSELEATGWVVVGAESSGEGEFWEFGMAGRAEVTGDGGFGGISSARTNASEGHPQCCE